MKLSMALVSTGCFTGSSIFEFAIVATYIYQVNWVLVNFHTILHHFSLRYFGAQRKKHWVKRIFLSFLLVSLYRNIFSPFCTSFCSLKLSESREKQLFKMTFASVLCKKLVKIIFTSCKFENENSNVNSLLISHLIGISF